MKNKLVTGLLVLMAIITFSSCSTDKSMVAKGVDLNKYQYASFIQMNNAFGTATDIEIEPGIYGAVEATRLQMIGDRRIEDLTQEQKEQLVLVKYAATSTPTKSTLSINFEDYMTGKTVASCRSSNKNGWTRQRDVKKSIRKLTRRVAKVWN